jgi:hypothetical protein
MQRESSRRRERQAQELNSLLANWPALAAYIIRVGAITRNFRSHAIQEMDEDSGYWRDLARIKVESDGSVVVRPGFGRAESIDAEQFEPTAAEQEQIKAEAAKGFPKSIKASDLPPDLNGVDPKEYFVFRDPEGLTLMVQWRRVREEDGRPYYLPFCKWSDGVWRMMEPDGLLPLYGLDTLKHGERWLVMVHEGAKCARHVQTLVDNKVDHPWLEDLDRYDHVGWPGGVNGVDRVDWEPLKQLAWDRDVVLVCDNDLSGMNVARPISRQLQRPLMMVRFDSRFPNTFDLADEWPRNPKWWQRDGRYCGPTLDDFLFPATWATKTLKDPSGQSDKPIHKIVDPFAKEWMWCEDLDVFVNRRQVNRLRPRKLFNSRVRPFSDVEDTARLFLTMPSPACDGVTYDPGEGARRGQRRRQETDQHPQAERHQTRQGRPGTVHRVHGAPVPDRGGSQAGAALDRHPGCAAGRAHALCPAAGLSDSGRG